MVEVRILPLARPCGPLMTTEVSPSGSGEVGRGGRGVEPPTPPDQTEYLA